MNPSQVSNRLPFLAWVGIIGFAALGLPLLAAWWSLRTERRHVPEVEVAPVEPVRQASCVRLIPKDDVA